MKLKGKVAIVTGAGQGLGKAYAERLAADGASVVVAEINEASGSAVAKAVDGLFVKVDVSQRASCESMAKAALGRFGRIDVLVNNAAVSSEIVPDKPFWELADADWDRVMNVNARGTWLSTCAVLPAMQKQKSGRIINVASGLALHAMFPNYFHYIASKGAVVAMTRAMARSLGEYNITANTVYPGNIPTEHFRMLTDDKDLGKERMKLQSLKRLGTPQDLANVVAFLASDDSAFVTGQSIVVDGGVHFS
jgi:3-oxoacyl-[acyl-carrier protein] reductase